MTFLNKLKDRWNVKSTYQVILILITFSFTGISIVFIKEPLYNFLGIDVAPFYVKILATLFLIIPLYQILLLGYGFIFGQFSFFITFEKKTLQRVKNLFNRQG